MASMDPKTTVARIATERPLSIPVFHRHRIDFCCGGLKSLDTACGEAGITTERFLGEVELEEARTKTSDRRWDEAPLDVLLDHILTHYHRPLDEALPRLTDWTAAALRAHGDKFPDLFGRLSKIVTAVCEDLVAHLEKEEQVVFPWIRGGSGATAGEALGVLEREHEVLGALLAEIRVLTGDYRVPAEACATWRALWEGLESLERETHEHIHLENNVLFPRALAGG